MSTSGITGSVADSAIPHPYATGMAARKAAPRRRRHLYILEWMKARGLSDEQLAQKVGTTRVTIWRWANEQHRLNPEKIARLAAGLDLEPPELWRPPSRRSIDAILVHASDDLNDMAVDIVERLVKRAP